jgi:hypothetical protein
MKQKFTISRSEDTGHISIREYGELDKEMLSLLCEETFDANGVEKAIGNGPDAVVELIRTRNLFPPRRYSRKIAQAIEALVGTSDNESIELFFDDLELLSREQRPKALVEEIEEDTDEIDDLLEDNFEDDYTDDETPIKALNSSIKVADDDSPDAEDDL